MAVSPYKILFLYHSPGNWYNMEYLYQRCVTEPRLELTVALVPQVNSTNVIRQGVVNVDEIEKDLIRRGVLNDGAVERMQDIKVSYTSPEVLDANQIPYIMGKEIDWVPGIFDLVVFGYPYEDAMYPAFHMQHIKQYVKWVVYLPYGIDIATGPTLMRQSYFQPIHTHGDALFYPSEGARQKFLAARPDAKNRVFATSTPRFDRLYRIAEHPVDPELKAKVAGRFCVLINHHFTFYVNRWSTFDFTFSDYLDFFSANQEQLACIWRPHPNIERILVMFGFFDVDQVRNIFKVIEQAGIIVDTSHNHMDAFALSDCFISDCSSMFIDYIGTGKPMILQNNPQGYHIYDKYDRELMDCYYQGSSAEEGIQFVENIFTGKDPKKVMRKLAQKRFVTGFDGQATERVYQKIIDLLDSGKEME